MHVARPPRTVARRAVLTTASTQPKVDARPPLPAPPTSRRTALAAVLLLATPPAARAALTSTVAAPPATPTPNTAPNPALYDPNDDRLRAAANALQSALNAESLDAEERGWTAVITAYEPLIGDTSAPWAPDIVGRAYGNRGNARLRGGRADAALADLNKAIALCPWSVDPVLGRGVALEQSGRFAEAERDYRAVLAATGDADPSAFNNLGNVQLLQGKYVDSERSYGRAMALAPDFSFAAANRAAVLYQLGRDADAVKEWRRLTRRYPSFDDARAGLAAALWAAGDRAAAEGELARVDDPRYASPAWLADERRWPPRLVEASRALLALQ